MVITLYTLYSFIYIMSTPKGVFYENKIYNKGGW